VKRFAIISLLLCLAYGTAQATMRLDLNEDGAVNILDVLAFLAHLTGQKPIPDAESEYIVPADNGQDTIPLDGFIAPEELSQVAPLDSVYDLPIGTEMVVRTVWRGTKPQDFVVKYFGIVDIVNSSFPMILLEASDPRLVQLGGAVAGMSGSPIIYNEKIVGALSWSFTSQAYPPFYFFATAIEDMLNPPYAAPSLASSRPLEYRGNRLAPIGISMMGHGFSPELQQKLVEKYPDVHVDFLENNATGLTDITPALIPGGAIGVSLVVGEEVNYTGVGTVTFVDEEKVYAFGHSMEQYGNTELPFVAAEITSIISSLDNAFKIGKVGNEVLGTIYYDGFPCIIGEIDRQPDLFDTELVAHLLDGQVLTQQHRVAQVGLSDFEKYLYSATALFSPPLNRLDNYLGYSVRMRTEIIFEETALEQVDRTVVFTDPNMGILELILEGADDYLTTGDRLTFQQFTDPTPERVKLEMEVVDSVLSALITDMEIDSILAPGDQVIAVVKMIVARNEEREISVTLDIPWDFPQGIYFVTAAPLGYFFEGDPPSGMDEIIDELNRGLQNTAFSVRLNGFNYDELSVDSEDLGLVLTGEVTKEIEIKTGE